MKVLIVEDSKTQAERLRSILEDNGYEVAAAVNGKDALSKINQFKPDLLISDIVMPEMNGYELCRSVRKDPQYKNLTLILLSTLSEVEDIVTGLESGANYIISKPYNDDYLLKHLYTAITNQRMRQSQQEDRDVKILINGNEHIINVHKAHIVDFLLSIYDTAVNKNRELYNTRLQLEELNNILEKKVEERTAALLKESEERKRYEQQFMESQKLESIGKLTGGIAHDFNNLLLVALGNLEMLTNYLDQNGEEIQHVKQALRALERGSELTRHLLSFARKQALFPKSINIAEHLDYITTLLKPALSERVKIIIKIADDAWPIWVDPIQFENAIMNISINARDAMPKGGEIHFDIENVTITENNTKISDTIEQLKAGDYVRLRITDQGEGMPKEVMERIFEPFYTTKKVGVGTGLGLSMVYGFIKQSNGNISVASELGHGTTFTIYLPRSNEPAEQAVEAKPLKIASVHGSEAILVVEDEAPVLKLVSAFLRKLGYDVITAGNGTEALEIIKSTKPIDLLFTDVIMPGDINGPELAVEAKKIRPDLKLLFTSGYSKDALQNRELSSMKIQIQHITKPYKLDALGAKLRTILDRKNT